MNENNFDQIEDNNMQDSITEDEVKSETIIEKYKYFNIYLNYS